MWKRAQPQAQGRWHIHSPIKTKKVKWDWPSSPWQLYISSLCFHSTVFEKAYLYSTKHRCILDDQKHIPNTIIFTRSASQSPNKKPFSSNKTPTFQSQPTLVVAEQSGCSTKCRFLKRWASTQKNRTVSRIALLYPCALANWVSSHLPSSPKVSIAGIRTK